MSSNKQEYISIYTFELNYVALPTDKFQLTEEHDQAKNNILEMHSRSSHSSYTKEFDVKTYIVDSIECKMCSLHSFEFSKRLPNLYTTYRTLQCQHLQQTNKNQTKIQQKNYTT
jgi:hypothetical protein